jgi:hypothetical protein
VFSTSCDSSASSSLFHCVLEIFIVRERDRVGARGTEIIFWTFAVPTSFGKK